MLESTRNKEEVTNCMLKRRFEDFGTQLLFFFSSINQKWFYERDQIEDIQIDVGINENKCTRRRSLHILIYIQGIQIQKEIFKGTNNECD